MAGKGPSVNCLTPSKTNETLHGRVTLFDVVDAWSFVVVKRVDFA